MGEGGLDPGAEERGEPAVGRDELGEFDVRGVEGVGQQYQLWSSIS